MEFLKNPSIAALVVIACGIVFYFENTRSYFGKCINRFFPCAQNPEYSFPCYGQYDIYLMIAVVIVGLIFLGFFIFSVYK